jgi:hypothetical protein
MTCFRSAAVSSAAAASPAATAGEAMDPGMLAVRASGTGELENVLGRQLAPMGVVPAHACKRNVTSNRDFQAEFKGVR